MSYERTPQHRALRAEMIRRWKPWEKSIGPKTAEGKERSALRGYKGNVRQAVQEISKLLRGMGVSLKKFDEIVVEAKKS